MAGAVENIHGALPYIRFAPILAIVGVGVNRIDKVHRPRLLKSAASDHLWISTRAGPQSQQSLYIGICRVTEELFGHPINPHLFRDCAASAIATDDPERVLATARILGHGSIETTTRHYNQSRMVEAIEVLHEVLVDIRHQEGAA